MAKKNLTKEQLHDLVFNACLEALHPDGLTDEEVSGVLVDIAMDHFGFDPDGRML